MLGRIALSFFSWNQWRPSQPRSSTIHSFAPANDGQVTLSLIVRRQWQVRQAASKELRPGAHGAGGKTCKPATQFAQIRRQSITPHPLRHPNSIYWKNLQVETTASAVLRKSDPGFPLPAQGARPERPTVMEQELVRASAKTVRSGMCPSERQLLKQNPFLRYGRALVARRVFFISSRRTSFPERHARPMHRRRDFRTAHRQRPVVPHCRRR
jgi:hypothetical protein